MDEFKRDDSEICGINRQKKLRFFLAGGGGNLSPLTGLHEVKGIVSIIKAAESIGFGVEVISRDDSNRLSGFDALFIRETTNVDHHTYRMSRKAAAEGLVVIDDPVSILRCSNKVYLAELLSRSRVSIPKTLIIHSKNIDQTLATFNLPCILKQPDSSFSQGVIMVKDRGLLLEEARRMLRKSDLVIAQEFVPTEFTEYPQHPGNRTNLESRLRDNCPNYDRATHFWGLKNCSHRRRKLQITTPKKA